MAHEESRPATSESEAARFDSPDIFRLIADKLERDPALLQIGLDKIAGWIANGATQQHRFRLWEKVIRPGLSGTGLLCDRS